MPYFVLIIILGFTAIVIFGLLLTVYDYVLSHKNPKDILMCLFVFIFIFIWGFIWTRSINDPIWVTTYYEIKRDGDAKYYKVDDQIISIDSTIDIKEYVVQVDRHDCYWSKGLYIDRGHKVSFVKRSSVDGKFLY